MSLRALSAKVFLEFAKVNCLFAKDLRKILYMLELYMYTSYFLHSGVQEEPSFLTFNAVFRLLSSSLTLVNWLGHAPRHSQSSVAHSQAFTLRNIQLTLATHNPLAV